MSTQKFSSPIIVRNSPVSFVITGARGTHREVLVRSAHDNLDLVGLDGQHDVALPNRPRGVFSQFVIPGEADLGPLIIRSDTSFPVAPVTEEPNGVFDRRVSYLTFAWKGMATEEDITRLATEFSYAATDIREAIERRAEGTLEWLLSRLVLICDTSTRRITLRTKARQRIFLLSGGFYVALIALAILTYFARYLTRML
jgi:hypothetical protein